MSSLFYLLLYDKSGNFEIDLILMLFMSFIISFFLTTVPVDLKKSEAESLAEKHMKLEK